MNWRKSMTKFKQMYKETFKRPYPISNVVEKGPNGSFVDGVKYARIELRAMGNGFLDGEPVEFFDMRIYTKKEVA